MPQNIIINAHTIIPHTGPDIVWLLHPKIVPINATIIPMETTNVIVVYVFTISDNMKTITILCLHLGYGGIEKYISSLCEMLKDDFKIKISFPEAYNNLEYTELVDYIDIDISSWQKTK